MKILVVDDMPSMRQVMMHMLKSIGYEDLEEASDGKQAVTMLYRKQYDLLITDLYMPKLNGRQLLEMVRKDKKLARLPVLMVTCEDDKKLVHELIDCKVTGLIIKPFTTNILKKHLKWIHEVDETNDEAIQLDC